MNLIHSSIWNEQTGTYVAVSENTRSAGKKISSRQGGGAARRRFRCQVLATSLMLACGASVMAQPVGGTVAAGTAVIGGTPGSMIITQTTPNVVINWQSFGIQGGQSVHFVQPTSSSVALNRVTGADGSRIMGSLSSNGKVFLVNPNGILFGSGASVNVGGLVASTLAISDANFMANKYQFTGAGTGAVVNQGAINAVGGGYVALLGANVSNQGVIAAQLGTIALAGGNAITLDMAGDKLLSVKVDEGALNALVENTISGRILADGGTVLMTTQSAGSLLANAVNNSGLVQAQTIGNDRGTIVLRAGMDTGTVTLAGTLDASAPPAGGNGGSVQTAAARVKIVDTAVVTTAAASGSKGLWTLESQGFTIGTGVADNITGTTLSKQLVTNNVTISTLAGGGDIDVNDAVEWTASSTPTTLTLLAAQDVNFNASVTATNGNLVACCGQDVNVKLGTEIATTNGSVLLNAGRNLNLWGALTTTDGNVSMCAANDVTIGGKITLTHTTGIRADQSLGLPLGLVLSAGYGAGAPGVGGTVVFEPGVLATVTNAPTTVYYNPVAYSSPTDYANNIIGAAPVQRMLVFAQGQDKIADGTTTATVAPVLQGSPIGDVTLVAGPGSTAVFDTADAGANKTITMTGYSLGGADAAQYALAVPCCGPAVTTATASITPAVIPPVVTPPVVTPPVVTPPVVTPPVVTPPVVTPPVVTPPVVTPPVVTPPEGNPLPPVRTPSTSPAPVPAGYVFTEPAPMPVPSNVLVVENPPAPPLAVLVEEIPVVTPSVPYQAPVRKPKPERN